MPMRKEDYPENWEWLSQQVIKDAGNRCELCYAPNHEFVYRDKTEAHPWELAENMCESNTHKIIRIVLTVHHIDFDKKNNNRLNLLALCQQCHLKLDLYKHIKNRKKKSK